MTPAADWSAQQYLKFEDERTRPARDLLAAVPLVQARFAVDLGCGPGNSTELVAARFPGADVLGVDTSPDMLAAAAKRLASARFTQADVGTWAPEQPVDLIFGNAVLQWVPDHATLLPRLMGCLASGGVLAVQLPDNLAEKSHTSMADAARALGLTQSIAAAEAARTDIMPIEALYDVLAPVSSRVEIWRTTYQHPLANAAAIVEWFKGTGLKPYIDGLDEARKAAFLAEYHARIAVAYPPRVDGRVLLSFPRLFFVAVR
jgi:trans-aconitate 2-methyltransferase